MKILLDTCVWGGARQALEEAGHDVIWSGDWPADPGDSEIMSQAYRDDRILITLDKDFGELAIIRGEPHCGIIRLVSISARKQADVCNRVILLHGDELQAGAIITVESGRLRIRPPEGSVG